MLSKWMHVRCRSIRDTFPNQIEVGQSYFIERETIYIDEDGDAYGLVYDIDFNLIGNIKLAHFSSL